MTISMMVFANAPQWSDGSRWIIYGALLLIALPVLVAVGVSILLVFLRFRYGENIARIFLEKPLFIIPRGKPLEGAEDIVFQSPDGLTLRGCYLRTTAGKRLGVIMFGLEYGSNRWSCGPYCENLIEAGYDVFAWEPRSQGESEKQVGYEPLQWVTESEVGDAMAALSYLRSRPDADPRGIGLYGISKGANMGLVIASRDPSVLCLVTDGAFATYTTMVPYMRVWASIYDKRRVLHGLFGDWFYEANARAGVRKIERERNVKFAEVETAVRRLQVPWLTIHGGGDTYIKPDMALALHEISPGPKELWVVDGAKHNQALTVAGDEYRQRVLAFFNKYIGGQA